jgi:hypothetical protein
MRRGAAPPRDRFSHAQSQKKNRRGPGAGGGGSGTGGAGSGGPGAPRSPPPSRDPPPHPPHRDRPAFGALGALGSTEAVARTGVLFRKMKKYTLSLKLSKKQLFILWMHGQRDQAGGKLERENLRFAVKIHSKRLSGLEAHT